MIDIAVTRMSSKGQIVIPAEMRTDIKEGEKLLIIKDEKRIIMKRAKDISRIEEDVIFAKRTEEALKRHERGETIQMEFDEFLNLLRNHDKSRNRRNIAENHGKNTPSGTARTHRQAHRETTNKSSARKTHAIST
ncbi:MAG: AbrB/MazE/SpoVT family DNA-binding domain-containing protein [archaeon]